MRTSFKGDGGHEVDPLLHLVLGDLIERHHESGHDWVAAGHACRSVGSRASSIFLCKRVVVREGQTSFSTPLYFDVRRSTFGARDFPAYPCRLEPGHADPQPFQGEAVIPFGQSSHGLSLFKRGSTCFAWTREVRAAGLGEATRRGLPEGFEVSSIRT